jgi:CBS domain containing-hemolysin-like protein
MSTLIIIFIIVLGVSFVSSLLESMILSVSKAHIAVLEKAGRRSGGVLRKLKRSINRPLAAILTLNTVVNTIGAAAIGAQTYRVFGSEWVALSSALLTVLILVFGEVFPKTMGATHWKRISPAAGYVITGLMFILYPVVKLLESIQTVVSGKTPQKSITREEIVVLAEMGVSEGVLHGLEARIIENLLLLNEIRTEDIMTPRSVVEALQKDSTVADAMESDPPVRFTRIPVYGRDFDDLIGLVLRDRLVEKYHTGGRDLKIESLMGPIFAVPASKPIADLLDEFITRRDHLFEVVDEYGGTAGIVTLEDALETLLGAEIVDELDSVADMRAYAVDRWKQKHGRKGP